MALLPPIAVGQGSAEQIMIRDTAYSELPWESVRLMMNLLRGRESGPKRPDFSLHSHHYGPQNHAILASLPLLLAAIPLSPTDS